jgi:hypothetical protein
MHNVDIVASLIDLTMDAGAGSVDGSLGGLGGWSRSVVTGCRQFLQPV